MLTCFDIGGSWIKPGHSKGPGQMEPRQRVETPKDYSGFVAAIKAALAPKSRAVSISVAGVVDPITGVMRIANLPA